jgi:hypothetical protein
MSHFILCCMTTVDPKRKTVSQVSKQEIDACVQAMINHDEDEEVVASACFALHNTPSMTRTSKL